MSYCVNRLSTSSWKIAWIDLGLFLFVLLECDLLTMFSWWLEKCVQYVLYAHILDVIWNWLLYWLTWHNPSTVQLVWNGWCWTKSLCVKKSFLRHCQRVNGCLDMCRAGVIQWLVTWWSCDMRTAVWISGRKRQEMTSCDPGWVILTWC